MRRNLGIAIVLLSSWLCFLSSAYADASKLLEARSLRCTFQTGNRFSVNGSGFKASEAEFGEKGQVLMLDSINVKERTARVIGNQGASDLMVFLAGNGLNFIEVPGSTVSFYTVFTVPTGTPGEFYAVNSRHTNMFDMSIVPQQYPGKCKIWE